MELTETVRAYVAKHNSIDEACKAFQRDNSNVRMTRAWFRELATGSVPDAKFEGKHRFYNGDSYGPKNAAAHAAVMASQLFGVDRTKVTPDLVDWSGEVAASAKFLESEVNKYFFAPKRLQRLLIVPDTHRPYHDKKAWSLLLRVGVAFKPDIIITLGDLADMFTVSSHNKSPSRKLTIADEVADVNIALDELDAIGASRKLFIEGNHEERISRYISTQAPALHGLAGTTTPELFRLKERGWEFTPYRHHTKVGKLYITHDAGNAGSQAHAQAGRKFQGNVVIGHVHRINMHYFGSATGESHVAASFGWLGAPAAGEEYMNQVNMNVDWHLGFGLGWMDEDGNVMLQAVPIINYTAVVNGELIV